MTILPLSFRALALSSLFITAPLSLLPQAFANTAVPLPQISPEQISQDIERRQNPATGAVEFYAPSFDPFESIENIAGTVALRSNTRITATDGHILRGGALLDINFFYTTESSDPYDIAEFDQAVFLSGDDAQSVFYDNRIIECSEKVSEVVYDKQYYNGASFGVLGGIYRPFPRYRGHRHFGNRGFGYDWRYPRGFSGRGGFNRRSGFSRHNRFIGGRGFSHNRDDQFRDRGETGRRDRDGRFGDNLRREDRGRQNFNNQTRREREIDRHNDRGGDEVRERYGYDEYGRRTGGGRGRRGDDARRDNRRDGRHGHGASYDENPDKSDYSPRRGLRTIKGGPRRSRTNDRRSRSSERPIKSQRGIAAAQGSETIKRSAPVKARGNNQTQPRPIKRVTSQPKRSQPKQSRSKRSQPKFSQPQRSQPKPSINRAVNKSFRRSHRSKGAKKLNFFPQGLNYGGGGYVAKTVTTSRRCAREENLSIYIPRDRLDAARYDGLTVLVLDRDGKDIPVYIPPNYIEGFRSTVFGAASLSQAPLPPSGYSFGPATPQPSYKHSGHEQRESGSVTYGSANYENGAVLAQEQALSQGGIEDISSRPVIYGDPSPSGGFSAEPLESDRLNE